MAHEPGHPARVQVSSSGKPLHYFVELSKRFLQEHGEVQLSAIGLAIPQAVNVSQILTTSGYATELRIRTGLLLSDEGSLDGASGTLPKGMIEIVLRKSDEFEGLVAGGVTAVRTQRKLRQDGTAPEEVAKGLQRAKKSMRQGACSKARHPSPVKRLPVGVHSLGQAMRDKYGKGSPLAHANS